jgi:threonine/homoserine/homoserine lactone efflux protein
MEISAILGFWAIAALLIIIPGPDWAFAISAGLRGQIVPAALGIVLGYLAITVLLAAGGGALVAASPSVLTVLTIVGGGYLIWLGISAFAKRATPVGPTDGGEVGRGPTAAIARGIGVSGLNPKGLLTLVAILPQFVNPASAWPVAGQLGLLGLVFALTCAMVYLIVGSCSHRLLGSRPGIASAVSRMSGACMIIVGAGLMLEHAVA